MGCFFFSPSARGRDERSPVAPKPLSENGAVEHSWGIRDVEKPHVSGEGMNSTVRDLWIGALSLRGLRKIEDVRGT